jgi:hypothetical protein
MEGQIFIYGSHHHYVKDVKIDSANEMVTINTNSTVFEKDFQSIDAFLKYWRTAGMANTLAPVAGFADPPVLSEGDQKLFEKMGNIIMDNIEKVKADPTYIPQAVVVNSNINSMIDLMKTKAMVTKELGNRNRRQQQLLNAKAS